MSTDQQDLILGKLTREIVDEASSSKFTSKSRLYVGARSVKRQRR